MVHNFPCSRKTIGRSLLRATTRGLVGQFSPIRPFHSIGCVFLSSSPDRQLCPRCVSYHFLANWRKINLLSFNVDCVDQPNRGWHGNSMAAIIATAFTLNTTHVEGLPLTRRHEDINGVFDTDCSIWPLSRTYSCLIEPFGWQLVSNFRMNVRHSLVEDC